MLALCVQYGSTLLMPNGCSYLVQNNVIGIKSYTLLLLKQRINFEVNVAAISL